jgi:hypothetical protein
LNDGNEVANEVGQLGVERMGAGNPIRRGLFAAPEGNGVRWWFTIKAA